MTAFELRRSLDDLVYELTRSFNSEQQAHEMQSHVCRPTRYQQCDHGPLSSRSAILDRLARLVREPGVNAAPADDGSRGGRSRSKAPAGSPAPWSAAPAELLDEILRGAVVLQSQCRSALHLSEVVEEDEREIRLGRQVITTTVAPDMLGRRALARLPGLVDMLRRDGHPLGTTILADGRVRPGKVEQRVRRWHSRALVLLGHEVQWRRLAPAVNPDVQYRPEPPGRGAVTELGPVCAAPSCGHELCRLVRMTLSVGHRRIGPVCTSCSHPSCDRVRRWRSRYLPARCPDCFADSLRSNPGTGEVRCLRPHCEDVWLDEEFEAAYADPWGDFDVE